MGPNARGPVPPASRAFATAIPFPKSFFDRARAPVKNTSLREIVKTLMAVQRKKFFEKILD